MYIFYWYIIINIDNRKIILTKSKNTGKFNEIEKCLRCNTENIKTQNLESKDFQS